MQYTGGAEFGFVLTKVAQTKDKMKKNGRFLPFAFLRRHS